MFLKLTYFTDNQLEVVNNFRKKIYQSPIKACPFRWHVDPISHRVA